MSASYSGRALSSTQSLSVREVGNANVCHFADFLRGIHAAYNDFASPPMGFKEAVLSATCARGGPDISRCSMKFEALRGGRISAARTRKRDWCAWQRPGKVFAALRVAVCHMYIFPRCHGVHRKSTGTLPSWYMNFWSSENQAHMLPRALRRSSCHWLYVVNIDLKYLYTTLVR